MIKKIFVEVAILSTSIRLDTFNFGIKKEFDMLLKTQKSGFYIRFSMKKIDPTLLGEIINKTHVVLKTTNRGNCRTPNISINEL